MGARQYGRTAFHIHTVQGDVEVERGLEVDGLSPDEAFEVLKRFLKIADTVGTDSPGEESVAG